MLDSTAPTLDFLERCASGSNLTQYTLIQVLMAIDEYNAAACEYNTTADAAYEALAPFRYERVPNLFLLPDDAPPQAKEMDAMLLWDSEPCATLKFKRHSSEKYPIVKWLAEAARYRARTAKLQKLIQYVSEG